MGSIDPVRMVRVERVVQLDPTMMRVTFAALDGGTSHEIRCHAGHCGLFFPGSGDTSQTWPRVFTYRRWHTDGRFDVDFVTYAGSGPAARWSAAARVGDCIGWRHGGGPKTSLAPSPSGPWLVFGDATALPVISALLERAHRQLRGAVFLYLPQAAMPEPLDLPPAMSLHVLRQTDGGDPVKAVRRATGNDLAAAFVACEAGLMRALRRLVMDEFHLARDRVFTSGYWKVGISTEEVDAAKRRPDWFADTGL